MATPGTSLIGHGARNRALGNQSGDGLLRTWFIARSVVPDDLTQGVGVGSFPFFTGDVAWLEDATSIVPDIEISDPTGVLDGLDPLLPQGVGDTYRLRGATSAGRGVHHRPDDIAYEAYAYGATMRPGVTIFHAVYQQGEGSSPNHFHWYGDDTYNCQIGLSCYGGLQDSVGGDRLGDEPNDVKLFFGGAVVKTPTAAHFVPYASMGVVVKEPWNGVKRDPGSRICPPYQGAAGGLGGCGPLMTIDGREVDLFVTMTGTRPGSILEIGDDFVFTGQAWPTLDVKVKITVTSPSGVRRVFRDRASKVGYIDGDDARFGVTEIGIYTVHVSATQDRAVPSTGIAPDPAIIADGTTTLTEHGYTDPLSAVLGTADSTYRFFVAPPATADMTDTEIIASWGSSAFLDDLNVHVTPPAGTTRLHWVVTAPGVVIDSRSMRVRSRDPITIALNRQQLLSRGLDSIVLGADSLEISLFNDGPAPTARALNLRGLWPLGTDPEAWTMDCPTCPASGWWTEAR